LQRIAFLPLQRPEFSSVPLTLVDPTESTSKDRYQVFDGRLVTGVPQHLSCIILQAGAQVTEPLSAIPAIIIAAVFELGEKRV